MNPQPTIIPGLRSPYDEVGGMVHFGRMLDKMRLHRAGGLPPAWVESKGKSNGFDGRCCRFLGIEYRALEIEVLNGLDDADALAWAHEQGRKPSDEEVEMWNGFMKKLGWRDSVSERVSMRLKEIGLQPGVVETMFDFIDLDEGRPPRFGPAPAS